MFACKPRGEKAEKKPEFRGRGRTNLNPFEASFGVGARVKKVKNKTLRIKRQKRQT